MTESIFLKKFSFIQKLLKISVYNFKTSTRFIVVMIYMKV